MAAATFNGSVSTAWSVGANWTGGTGAGGIPAGGSGGDDCTVPKNLTVSLDGTSCVCKSLTLSIGTTGADVGGKLTADSSIDTKLVVHTSITFSGSNSGATFGAYSSIIDIDMSAASTKKCEIYTNGAAATTSAAAIDLAGKINLKGLTKTRWTLTQSALVGSDDGTGALTCDVDDATGWQVADKIVFATTQAFNSTPKVDKVTIATITAVGGGAYSGTGAATITWTDGTGTSPSGSLKYSHADNCLVGNLHSNLIFGPVVADQTFAMRVSCGARNTSAVINDVEFRSALAPTTFAWTGVLTLSGANGALSGISFNRNAFYDWTGIAVLGYLLDGDTPRSDNQFYSIKSVSNVFSSASPVGSMGDETDICVYRSTPGTTATYMASYAGTRLIDPKISGITALGAISLTQGLGDSQVTGGGIWSCLAVAYKSSGTNPLCTFTDTYLGKGFPGSVYSSANNSYIVNGSGAGNAEFNNCLENLSGGSRANGTGGSPASQTAFYNKNGVIADQEAYAVKYSGTTPVYVRETSVIKNATASLRIDTIADAAFSRTFDILVKGGVATSLFVYARKTGTFSTRPTAQLTGLGTSLPAVTMSTANDTWELLDLSYDAVDAPASDGLLTLTLSCQAASSLSAYFSGIPIPPWNSRCRHYGSMVNESSATQVADPAIDPAISQSTAAAYTDITITWGSTSSISIGADQTFKKLVHYTASQMIDNVGSALPITWAGAYNSPAIFAQGDINISGDTLNGSGSIDMGAHTLTATVPFTYTYTGGTFSQAAAVPTFAGGTLNIGAAGTYTYTQAAAMILSMTPTAPGTYALGDSAFTGQVDLRNTSGTHAITVELPTGTSYTTASNTGAAITISTPQLYQAVTVGGIAATYRIQIFDLEFVFTVSGVTVTPTAGATYTNNGITYTVRSTSIAAGSGTVTCWGTAAPEASGTLTKASGTGDATLTFSAYAVDGTELYIGVPGATSYTWTDGTAAADTRVIRVRIMEDGPGAADAIILIDKIVGTCGTTDGAEALSYLATSDIEADNVYNDRGVDGSAITGITIDDTTLRLEIASGTITNYNGTDVLVVDGRDLYAYETYWLGTTAGMRDEARFIEAIDAVNFRCSNFKLKGTSGYPIMINNCFIVDAATGIFSSMVDYSGDPISNHPEHMKAIVVTTSDSVVTGTLAEFIAAVPTANEVAQEVVNGITF